MLRACGRVLKTTGQLAFFTTYIPRGLSESDYRRAARAGPPSVTSARRTHLELLEAAGFRNIEETDLTDEYLRTTRRWLKAREQHASALRASFGEVAFADRQRDSRKQAAAIDSGLLQRSLFIATR